MPMFWGSDIAVAVSGRSFFFHNPVLASDPHVIPCYAARQQGTNLLLAVGDEALRMLGKAPPNIQVASVTEEGNLADWDAATQILSIGLKKCSQRLCLSRRAVATARSNSGIKEMLRTQVHAIGGREVYLMDYAMACAIGLELPVQEAQVRGVLAVEEDWFEFGLVSLASLFCSCSKPFGLETMVDDARWHLRDVHNFLIEREALKNHLLSEGILATAELRGWETWAGCGETGRPSQLTISPESLGTAVVPTVIRIAEYIKASLRSATPEQSASLRKNGVSLCGEAARVPGFAAALSQRIGIHLHLPQSRHHPAILGTASVLKEIPFMKQVVDYRKPRSW